MVFVIGVDRRCSSVTMITSTADFNIQNLAVHISDLFYYTECARDGVRPVYPVEMCLTV